MCAMLLLFFFFEQKTAYEMRISDWSSDVCSSDLGQQFLHLGVGAIDILGIARQRRPAERPDTAAEERADIGGNEAGEIEGVVHAFEIGRAMCRERVWQYV